VALTAWSAGYGAVARILDTEALGESLDAIILLDGFHSSFDGQRRVELTRLAAFHRFAQKAISGERLLTITHSEVETGTYPTSRETTDALLGLLGLTRAAGGARPEWPALKESHGVRKEKIPPLVPTTECHAGSFHVRGFTGGTKEDHMAHLIYMGTLALPDLARRWNTPVGATLRAK
jgi:hypothetical protein